MSSAFRAAKSTSSDVLAGVPLFAGLPAPARERLAEKCAVRLFAPGQRIVAELEPGEEAFVFLEGTGKVTVGGWSDEPPVEVGEVKPGDCIGEMALFTDELRSATVIATTPVAAMVVDRTRFLDLMERHPSIAAHIAATLAARLRENEQVLAAVLDPRRSDAERREALHKSARAPRKRRLHTAIAVAWRELVASRRRELPFLMLVSFIGALLAVRGAVALERAVNPGAAGLEALLRTSYLLGLFLIVGSGALALLLFRPGVRRVLACVFGTGMALLFNSLSVLLTFDLFYTDIFTPDPSLHFSIETLYDRAEGAHVAAVTAAILLQAVYLRGFYRRLFTLFTLRASRTLRG
ncbi:MAG TPA: cyclic nucleotide-binding domain-containing protein [bacterium]|nr:cyclic nucleotide-binding domain-containing protein [bacterium]